MMKKHNKIFQLVCFCISGLLMMQAGLAAEATRTTPGFSPATAQQPANTKFMLQPTPPAPAEEANQKNGKTGKTGPSPAAVPGVIPSKPTPTAKPLYQQRPPAQTPAVKLQPRPATPGMPAGNGAAPRTQAGPGLMTIPAPAAARAGFMPAGPGTATPNAQALGLQRVSIQLSTPGGRPAAGPVYNPSGGFGFTRFDVLYDLSGISLQSPVPGDNRVGLYVLASLRNISSSQCSGPRGSAAASAEAVPGSTGQIPVQVAGTALGEFGDVHVLLCVEGLRPGVTAIRDRSDLQYVASNPITIKRGDKPETRLDFRVTDITAPGRQVIIHHEAVHNGISRGPITMPACWLSLTDAESGASLWGGACHLREISPGRYAGVATTDFNRRNDARMNLRATITPRASEENPGNNSLIKMIGPAGAPLWTNRGTVRAMAPAAGGE
jgi:hypothetical protein